VTVTVTVTVTVMVTVTVTVVVTVTYKLFGHFFLFFLITECPLKTVNKQISFSIAYKTRLIKKPIQF
jgi:hypothetical protein